MNELQQDLLEMHYGLLDDAEAARLQHRIHTEPEVAALWAETIQMAGKFADAARLTGLPTPAADDAELDQMVAAAKRSEANPDADIRSASSPAASSPAASPAAEETIAESPTAASPAGTTASGSAARRSRLFGVRSFLLAASILLAVCGVRFWNQLPPRPATAMVLEADRIAGVEAEGKNEFRVATRAATPSTGLVGSASLPLTPASLTFSIYSQGALIFQQQQKSTGEATFQVPDDLLLPRGAQLRVEAEQPDGASSQISLPLRATRCLTYLSTDRPVYRPGETIFFRSLTLQRQTFLGEYTLPIRFQLLDPSSALVPGTTIEGVTDRGVGNGAITLPADIAGGSYTLVATSLNGVFPEERKAIEVRPYRVPRFTRTIQLDQRSYGSGDQVMADAVIRRAEGEPLAGAQVTATAVVDQQTIVSERLTTDEQGRCSVSFSLPTHIRVGVGYLSFVVDDGGTQETFTETIPIQTDRVQLEFYPEGGYLVEGVRNRVYFSARNTLGQPVHVEGEIMTRGGRQVTRLATTRDGMGRFEFVPEPGQRYVAKLSKPLDVSADARFPAVVANRPVLDTGSGVFAAGAPLDLVLRTTQAMKVRVQAACRGALVGESEAAIEPGSQTLRVPVSDATQGVVRVTLFDADTKQPLAERLVYRRSDRDLKVQVLPADAKRSHVPGQPLRLTLQVTDEADQPVAAVLGVSVVDQAALSLQTTETPTLKTHFLLTSEVEKPEDLEHANFYLEDSLEAAESLDLLLGTQGWRRFVYNDAVPDTETLEATLQRLLALDGSEPAITQRRSNHTVIQEQWDVYRTSLDRAWTELLTELRWLLLPLFLIWTLLAWVRSRSRSVGASAACLLLALSTSAWLVGCGVQQPATDAVMQDVAEAPTAGRAESSTEATPPLEMEPSAAMESPVAADEGAAAGELDPMAAPSDTLSPAPAEAPRETTPTTSQPFSTGLSIDPADQPALTEQDLQRLLEARGINSQDLAQRLFEELRFPVREYAHRHSTTASQRQDFAETLYWQPLLVTDSKGQATIRFDLSDSITSFRVHADAHASGRIGSGSAAIVSRIPFQVEPKLPLAVTVGDRIDLPVAVINASDQPQTAAVMVSADSGLRVERSAAVKQTSLAAGQRTRLHVPISVEASAAGKRLGLDVRGETNGPRAIRDDVRRQLFVAAAGYPQRRSTTATVSGSYRFTLDLPDDYVDGSLQITLRAYPSPLADLMAGVESVLAEPHGCFEQASAANYPNALALQYLQQNQLSNPQVMQRAEGFLDRGYQKLTSYECERRGYEWFGQDPGHEALSAFGLLQFNDMRTVMDIDLNMISRTRKWLMARRDGNGGWKRNPRHLHSWSVSQDVVNAYVLWALTEADAAVGNVRATSRELNDELTRLESVAMATDDAYLLALSAAALANVNRDEAASRLLEKLVVQQAEDGSLRGRTSVTQSGGKSLQVETTALAVIAWSKTGGFQEPRQRAAAWLVDSRDGRGGFGSTQATVLALKALLAFGNSATPRGGRLVVLADGNPIAEAALPEDAADGAMIEITGLAERLIDADIDPRQATLELRVDDGVRLPCSLDVAFHASVPESHPETALQLDVHLAETDGVAAGSIVQVDATVKNVTPSGVPMSVAVIGLPGGVEPRTEELDELRSEGVFDYYELRPREVILYWRTIAPEEAKVVRFHVTAEIPGRYTAPPSRAYLYYTAEQVHWTPPLEIEIQAGES
ncbi:MG2 domain-containing protein [Roseimaritima ulvae]|uniref:A-macroglobulin complement component n=1 Tax=Roseimaritima ulvae TaxID=980254 RepID=A0A5B9QNJ2_9BACT|nr:MG2 domain-containing protein [Roseimaritima ulvae]QEG40588.1 A-macroglobulin complement component [Roseimaritima ulvae]